MEEPMSRRQLEALVVHSGDTATSGIGYAAAERITDSIWEQTVPTTLASECSLEREKRGIATYTGSFGQTPPSCFLRRSSPDGGG